MNKLSLPNINLKNIHPANEIIEKNKEENFK
jgi:hypothetical protein